MQNNEPGFQSPKWNGPWVNAVHPGGVATDQQEQAIDAYGTKAKIGVKAVRPFLKDPVDEGCRSALFAATSEDVVTEKIQGQYVSIFFFYCRISPGYCCCCCSSSWWSQFELIFSGWQIVPDRKITDPSKQARDDELGENLWRLSEQILKEKLGGLPYQQSL